MNEPIVVKTRPKPGSSIKEVWAEGVMDAHVQDIQNTLMDADTFSKFMPYVKESRKIHKPDPDGGEFVYTRLELPMISSRDYVLKVYLDQSVGVDGTGDFRNRWTAVPDRIPKRHNSVRIRINEGSWHVRPRADGKSDVVYKFMVDPGGWVPAFAADMGNKRGILETFQAVEKEARRRGTQRGAASSQSGTASAAKPPQSVPNAATP
jgi:hypothetical protein